MKNIGKMFWEGLKHNLLIWPVALGGVLLLLILSSDWIPKSSGLEASIHIAFLDWDESPVGDSLYRYLTEELHIDAVTETDGDKLKDLLLNTDISGIICVPEGTYDRALSGEEWEIEITTLDDYENGAYLRAYLETYVQGIEVLSKAANGEKAVFEDMLLLRQETRELELVEFESIDKEAEQEIFGFIQMAGIFAMVCLAPGLFLVLLILEDKQYGIYRRIQLSGMKPVQYVGGAALLGILAEGVIVAGIAGYYRISERTTGISFGLFAAAFLIFGIFSVGLSITVALLSKNRLTALSFIVGYSSISCILGGSWFAIGENLGVLSKAAMLMPTYWFMKIIRGGEQAGYQTILSMAVLILFTVLVFLVSAMVFSKKKD